MKTWRAFSVLAILALLAVPVSAFATENGGGVDVTIDGSSFFQDGTEDPLARLHEAWILPCGEEYESDAWVYYYDFPHPDETWVDMGFPIAVVSYNWHYTEAGNGDYDGEVYGECFEAHTVIPKMYLYTSETGFYTDPEWFDGAVNTCVIVSDLGPASVGRIEALCGSVPVDINLTCAKPVDQLTPTDFRGHWSCDKAQRPYGEGRLDLFSSDGGGGKGTLYYVWSVVHQGHK